MAHYGGRFLIFDTLGQYEGQVEIKCAPYINKKRLKLVNFCESKKYFVFEGPEFTEKKKEDKKVELQKTE